MPPPPPQIDAPRDFEFNRENVEHATERLSHSMEQQPSRFKYTRLSEEWKA